MKQEDRRVLVAGLNVVNPRAVDGDVSGEREWRRDGCHRGTDQRNYKRESRSSKGEIWGDRSGSGDCPVGPLARCELKTYSGFVR
jgi:hypothetical protein